MISMLRPLRGTRCSQDLHVGGVKLCARQRLQFLPDYPRTPPKLSQIDEHRDGSHPRSALSQMSTCRCWGFGEQHVATALAVFDRRKVYWVILDNTCAKSGGRQGSSCRLHSKV